MTGPQEPQPQPRVRRVKGHRLSLEWSGEYGVESSSTGTCACGKWQESASNQSEVRQEYRWHLRDVAGQVPDISREHQPLQALQEVR